MSHPTHEGTVPWPDDVAADYRAKGFWLDQPIGDLLWQTADLRPEDVALVDGHIRMPYAELTDRADAAAGRLLALGLEPDDRVLVQMPNEWQFVVLTLACLRAGVIPVMALPAHRRHELTHLAGLSEARAVAVRQVSRGFDHEQLAHDLATESPDMQWVLATGEPGELDPRSVSLDQILAPGVDRRAERAAADGLRPHPDSPACFLISGGTTGLPKLITRTHNDYICNLRATAATAAMTEADVYLGTLPSSHNFPLACPGILGTLLTGGRVVMLPSPEPSRAFATIEQEGVTVAAAVPAVAQRWIEYQQEHGGTQTRSLRVLQVGGSRLPDEYAVRIAPALGATLQQVFGMAEGLINTTRLDDPIEVITTTQGRPVHEADEVRILDPAGVDLPDGEPGSIYTRGPYTPRGYYRAPEHNERAFLPDGWYGSGDIVVRRPDGNLVVQGRDKDMINRGGEKISAEEVEDLLYRIEAVEMVAAVSMPDPVLGERLCVYVVVKGGRPVPTLEEVRAVFAAAEVAAFKYPDRLEILGQLPLTKVGKIDKRALRQDIATRLAHPNSTQESAR
ncbi:(2,3-dihydroxybenzoyl)adenylate synthase [Segeticoccus rhizosphaerae]|uniref:(2,3-dihydroxybenzoyl)adenylate synthase n=1 Tax=Segeticoccus rhizosphaerae TaxID=1104777 RepID=UPI0012646D6E|nr:AMP-binding protein [Segeticoccus rhizosphaerae]